MEPLNEQQMRALETGKEARLKWQIPTIIAQALFGLGWAILVYQGSKLLAP